MTTMNHNSAKKVLILAHTFAPNVGGVETHLADLCRELSEKHIETVVLTYQPLVTRAKGLFKERIGAVTVYRFPWIGFGLFNKFEPYPLIQFIYLFPVLATMSFFYMASQNRNVGVIHAHGMVCAVIGRLLKATFRRRLVVSIHAVYGWLYNLTSNGILPRFLKWVLKGSDMVLCLAKRSREEMIAMGIPASGVATFTYWVDQQAFKPMDKAGCRRQLSLPDTFTVLFVGRLIPIKGVETLVQVSEKLPEVTFVFAGDGPLRSYLETSAASHPNIRFAGNVDNKNLPPYYNAADVLCVPSQYEEGFGRIIPEALSCGCPVIGANKGGIPEAMDSSVGILVDPVTDLIARAIESLRNDSARLESLKKNCVPYAQAKFSARNVQTIITAFCIKE